MACNAQNHWPGCTCGFGGDTGGGGWNPYGGGFGSGFWSRGWLADGFGTVESYTIPNVHCPVCGEIVFFYRSPYNGRVFFDRLGPPWPKHPCTDNGNEPRRTLGIGSRDDSEDRKPPSGRGWRPLYYPEVIRGKSTRVQGVLYEDRMQVLVLGATNVDRGPVFLRPIEGLPGFYEISYLCSDKDGTRDKIAFACDARLAEAGPDLLLRAARGEAEALAELGRFILYELGDMESAKPLLQRALEGGVAATLFDLAVIAIFSSKTD